MSSLSTPQLQLAVNGKQTSLSPMFIGAILFCMLSCSSMLYLFGTKALNYQQIIDGVKPNDNMEMTAKASWYCSSSLCMLSTLSMCYVTMKYASSPPPE
jgi:hypothetical protein